MHVVPPEQMMRVLHEPFHPAVRDGLQWADLAMLHAQYEEYPLDPRVQMAQTALAQALHRWSDDDVRTFLVVYFAEPPLSDHFQTLSNAQLRQELAHIYHSLFADNLEK
jgi:hypothetical protein